MAREIGDESLVAVDELALDKECIRLPSTYLRFALKAADYKKVVSEKEAELKVVFSEVSNKVRNNPNKYGIEKLTEAAVQAAVLTTEEYVEAQGAVREAQHDLDRASAFVWAMEHKKRALTVLVDLYGMGVHGQAKISGEGRAALEEATRRRVRRRGQTDDE